MRASRTHRRLLKWAAIVFPLLGATTVAVLAAGQVVGPRETPEVDGPPPLPEGSLLCSTGDSEILAVNPGEVRPGGAFIVFGRRLGNRPGDLRLFLVGPGVEIPLQTAAWRDLFLEVRLPADALAPGGYRAVLGTSACGPVAVPGVAITVLPTVDGRSMPSAPRPIEDAPVVRDSDGQKVVRDEVVVGLDPLTDDPDARAVQIAAATGGAVVGSVKAARVYQIRYATDSVDDLLPVIQALKEMTGVSFAAHHYVAEQPAQVVPGTIAIDPVVPDDSLYDTWSESAPGGPNWAFEVMRLPTAWQVTTGLPSVQVAVIDSGFDASHPDLRPNITASSGGRNFTYGGHGTHVAGTVCAKGNNGQGVAGVAWDCGLRLYEFGGVSSVHALAAMAKAAEEGASVVNMSLQWIDTNACGTPGSPATLQKVKETNQVLGRGITLARERGREILWVFAAGNECRDAKFASPASLAAIYPENVLAVGAIGLSGARASFSNFGELVSVYAPGEQILSTWIALCDGQSCEPYRSDSGTSMAAPHVTGLVALIRSAHPDWSAAQLRTCIAGAARLVHAGGETLPLVDAARALDCRM